jgi:hypothetical protein
VPKTQNFIASDENITTMGAVKGEMGSNYQCWRITGELVNSIDDCPVGSIDKCMYIAIGDICPGGKLVDI